jgi:8-oxo-dGTP pyrophosphatase MutT (NUDIX family)
MAVASDDPLSPPQVIPRPPGAIDGGPAPWEQTPAEERRGLSVQRVLEALERAGQSGTVPPEAIDAANWLNVIGAPPEGAPADEARRSAVLVALFEEAGEARVVLTRRSSALRAHRGEVSFPGGRMEEAEDPVAAARREAFEEVGLDPAAPSPRAWLHPVMTFVSRSMILPVVAVLAERPSLRASPAEVERVFDVALADLAGPGVFREERWPLRGPTGVARAQGSFPVWFFAARGEIIWGATARILFELLSLVLEGS